MEPKKETLKETILEELGKEFDTIPPIEELEKLYTFSDRHNKNMREKFDEIGKEES